MLSTLLTTCTPFPAAPPTSPTPTFVVLPTAMSTWTAAPTNTTTALPTATLTKTPTTTPTVRVAPNLSPGNANGIKELSSWRERAGSPIKQVSWSPDGRILAAVTPEHATLWQVSDGSELRTLAGAANAIQFSPDGQLLATGTRESSVKLWQVSSGRVLRTIEKLASTVTTVAFSPDGRVLFAGSTYMPQMWDVESLQRVGDIGTGVSGVVVSSAFSPDGKTLALGTGSARGGGVELWDVAKTERGPGLFDERDDKYAIAFSPNGALLASGSLFGHVKLWDVSTRRELRDIKQSASISTIAFSSDGQLLAVGVRDQPLKLLEVATGTELRSPGRHTGNINSVAFSPDGRTLATASEDGIIKIWGVSP